MKFILNFKFSSAIFHKFGNENLTLKFFSQFLINFFNLIKIKGKIRRCFQNFEKKEQSKVNCSNLQKKNEAQLSFSVSKPRLLSLD